MNVVETHILDAPATCASARSSSEFMGGMSNATGIGPAADGLPACVELSQSASRRTHRQDRSDVSTSASSLTAGRRDVAATAISHLCCCKKVPLNPTRTCRCGTRAYHTCCCTAIRRCHRCATPYPGSMPTRRRGTACREALSLACGTPTRTRQCLMTSSFNFNSTIEWWLVARCAARFLP